MLYEIHEALSKDGKIDILCLGTPQIVGDSLGPLVGTMITDQMFIFDVNVVGTKEYPVTASNYASKLALLRHGVYTLVVDAAIGAPQWSWQVSSGPIVPGAGKKIGSTVSLPPVGDAHIKGFTGTTLGEIVRCDLLLVYELATTISLELLALLRNEQIKDIYKNQLIK